jgi:hypothetical protein
VLEYSSITDMIDYFGPVEMAQAVSQFQIFIHQSQILPFPPTSQAGVRAFGSGKFL